MKRNFCKRTGKAGFRTRHEAIQALQRQNEWHRKNPGSVYWCNRCQQYHITHMSYAHGKTIRQLDAQYFYELDRRFIENHHPPPPRQHPHILTTAKDPRLNRDNTRRLLYKVKHQYRSLMREEERLCLYIAPSQKAEKRFPGLQPSPWLSWLTDGKPLFRPITD